MFLHKREFMILYLFYVSALNLSSYSLYYNTKLKMNMILRNMIKRLNIIRVKDSRKLRVGIIYFKKIYSRCLVDCDAHSVVYIVLANRCIVINSEAIVNYLQLLHSYMQWKKKTNTVVN